MIATSMPNEPFIESLQLIFDPEENRRRGSSRKSKSRNPSILRERVFSSKLLVDENDIYSVVLTGVEGKLVGVAAPLVAVESKFNSRS